MRSLALPLRFLAKIYSLKFLPAFQTSMRRRLARLKYNRECINFEH